MTIQEIMNPSARRQAGGPLGSVSSCESGVGSACGAGERFEAGCWTDTGAGGTVGVTGC